VSRLRQKKKRQRAAAALELGKALLISTEDNLNEALDLFKRQAKQGNPLFESKPDRDYERHFAIEKSWYETVFGSEKDEKKFDAHIAYMAGMHFLRSNESALEAAVILLQKAAQEGHLEAAFELSKLFKLDLKDLTQEDGRAIDAAFQKETAYVQLINSQIADVHGVLQRANDKGILYQPLDEAMKQSDQTTTKRCFNIYFERKYYTYHSMALNGMHKQTLLEKVCSQGEEAKQQIGSQDLKGAYHTLQNIMKSYAGISASQKSDSVATLWLNANKNSGKGNNEYAVAEWLLENLDSITDEKVRTQQRSDAVTYLRLATKARHATACFALGKLYEEGTGVPKSYGRAIYYYTQSKNKCDLLIKQLNECVATGDKSQSEINSPLAVINKKREAAENALNRAKENRTNISKINEVFLGSYSAAAA